MSKYRAKRATTEAYEMARAQAPKTATIGFLDEVALGYQDSLCNTDGHSWNHMVDGDGNVLRIQCDNCDRSWGVTDEINPRS